MDLKMFSRATQALLADKVICHETLPGEYAFLQNETHNREVLEFLIRIDRSVRSTSDGKGFHLAYVDLDEPKAKTDIRRTFKQFASEIEPYVRWMRLARDCNPTGRPIEAGLLVNESEMLGYIERSPELNHALTDLTKNALFKSAARDGKGRIRHILNKLESEEYLIKLDASGSRYRATAKWSYLYDVLEFIASHERLDIEDTEQTQGGLL
ncbi:hypothetical protein ACFVYJ_13065 [Pontibacter sp. JAM-7]|uniref:hypothetical protein n=1 Tax=Pontibacter sp. JAM-7 TaxID=3366581 RepID=UPI003AF83FE2